MAKDMSFGSDNFNKASMSRGTEGSLEISDLYQNEESIDLSSYLNTGNLELCDDDLFTSLFPSTELDNNIKTEKPDYEPELNDWWTDPSSIYPPACSSAAQSPVQFFNTPPVTPKSDCHTISPETIHPVRQDRQAQFSMSRTQLSPMIIMEEQSNIVNNIGANEVSQVSIKSDPDTLSMNGMYYIKSEDDLNCSGTSTNSLLPALVKARPIDLNEYPKKRQANCEDESGPAKRSKPISKESDEYKMKRERNNVAVRKSRDKAKIKSIETQKKVSELSSENSRLRDRVAELTHELNTLKSILKSLPQSAHLQK